MAVSAPAGYGKTSGVMLWAESDARPFAWVQLTAADNDPVHLGRHIALALDALIPIGAPRARLLLGSGRSPDLDIFPTLARVMEDESPLVLVLDDLHTVRTASALRGIEALLAAIPAGSQVTLVGRNLPVRLGRHEASGQVIDLTAGQLAMDATEARLLLEEAGVELDDEELDDLVARTEGWPAGLHLAALANGGRSYVAFSGRDRLTGDFLVEEVLDATSPDMVEFLECSATLEYMDAEQLDVVLERSDSGRMLEAIESSGNLFLVPLDNERRRFRYHHLFRDVLQARLRTNDPALAQHLDSRTSALLEQAGDVDGAVRHAIDAHEEQRAADLILRATLPRFFDGRYAQVAEWLALLGPEAINRYPAAAVATAWCGIASGEAEQVIRACAAAERFSSHGPLSDGSPSLPVALATVRVILGADGVDGLIRDAEIVREAGGPATNPWWALATGAEGTAYSMLGQFERARQLITQALAVARGTPFLEAAGAAHLALVTLHEGDLVEADRLADEARRLADDHHLDGFAPAVGIYAIAALVAARARRSEQARRAAFVARSIVTRLGDVAPRTPVFVFLLLAQTAVALGERAEARLLLEEAQRARRRDPSATFLNEQLDLLAEQMHSASDLSTPAFQPLTTAELRVLDYLPTHLSLQEIAGVLLISRNTAKSHTVSIYRKLAASSRAEAVVAARHFGLLSDL